MSPVPDPPVPTPASPEYFEYRAAAAAAGITTEQLRRIQRIFELDYPHDLMLRELHILRVCNAVRDGLVSVEQVLAGAGGGMAA